MGELLDFKAKVDFKQAKKDLAEFEKMLKSVGVSPSGAAKSFDTKPLTEYQRGLLEIKQAQLALAKQKQEQAAADKAASLALQAALREERQIKQAAAAQERKDKQEAIALAKQLAAEANKRKPTQLSNSQAEIDAYKKAKQGADDLKTSVNAVNIANAQAANAAVANAGAANQNTNATNANALSKKQLAQMVAEEKLRIQQATAETKNNAREQLNAKGSIEQRRAALIRLTTAYDRLSKAERESAAGTRMRDIIKGVSDQLKQLEAETGRHGRNVGNYADGVSAFFSTIKANILSTMGPLALLTAAWTAAKAAFNNNVEVSDYFVDVQRTAKLSSDEVDKLGDQLKKINTRTNLEGLLDIGFIGGRLGVAKEDMVGFITTVDQLAVVLKKELPGGADAVATALGKVISVYKITQNEGITLEQALKNTGSTFLELAHNGQVTVQYLQDFSLRTAGVAQIAKISLPTMLAYGAVLSQAGITAQVAGSSVTRLISSLSTKRDKYFAIAQLADSTLTIEKFTDLINTDTKSALELFFKGLKAGNPTQTEFGDRLKTLALTTGAAKNAVIALAENQDLLFEKTKIANKANEKGTSVAHNFELANNSLAASFEKIGNSISNAFTSSAASRRLAELLNSLTDNRTEAEKLVEAYTNTKHETENLTAKLNPLVAKYDELNRKGKLSSDQQELLRSVTAQIGELLPGVTTKFDSYGNSIEISRGKVQELTKAQKELLELQNRDAVKTANKQFENAQKDLVNAKKEAVRLQSETGDKVYEFLFGSDAPRSIKTLRGNAKDRITELSGEAYEAAKAIRTLGGTLNKAQQDVINYYEAIDKKKKPKVKPATIVGDGTNEELTTDTTRTIEDIKADIKRVTELKAPLDTASKQYKDYVKQLVAFKKELKLAEGGVDSDVVKAESVAKTLISKRNTLQGEIDKMIAASSRKQMSSDDEEIQSVTDKYKVLREKAEDYYNELNKKIPKSKQKGFGLTLSGLYAAEIGEKDGIRDKQATEKLKVTLDKQKQLYDEFEAYKRDSGEESAKKLYSNLIDTDKTYLENLKAQKERLLNPESKAKGASDSDNALVEKQVAELNKRITEAEADAAKAQLDNYKKLLAENQTYLQQRKNMQEQYDKDSAALRAKGDTQEADELARKYQIQLTELDKSHVEQLKSYRDLFDNMDNMSTAALRRSVGNLKKEVGKLQLTPEAREFFDKMFNGLDQRVNSQSANDFKNMASALGDAAQYAGSLDENLGKALSTAANLAGQVGNIKQGLSDFKAAQKNGDGFGQVSSIIGIFGAVMGIFSGLAGLFDGSKRAAEQMQHSQELQLKATEAVTKALERQFGLIKEVYGTERLAAYKKQLDDISAAQNKANDSLKNKLSFTGNKIIDDYIEKFNKGIKNDYFNFDSVIDQVKNQFSLAGKTIKELQELLEKGLLDSSTAAIVQSLIDLEQQAKAVRNALTEEITGVNFDSLTDKIKGVFDSGETSAKNFADAIETSIQGAFSNAFKRKEIEQRMQPLFDALYKAGEDGTFTSDEIKTLRDMRDKISQELSDRAKVYEQIIGSDPSSADNISALQKGIKSITTDQASALEGILRGSYDQQKRMVIQLDAGNSIWRQQLDAAMSGIRQLEAIERNTANTVIRLDAAVTELKAINKNTGGQMGRDLGL